MLYGVVYDGIIYVRIQRKTAMKLYYDKKSKDPVFVNLNVSHFWLKYQSKSEPHFFLSFTMNGKGGYQKGDKTYEQIRNH